MNSLEHETPQQNIKFDKSKTFDVKTEENSFKLKISYNEKIFLFEIEKKDQFPKNEYGKLLTLDDLTKIDRFFLQFETTEDVINSLDIMVQNKNLNISEEDQKMKIEIVNPSNKRTFGIDIPLKEKDLRSEVNNLINYIATLNERISSVENKNKELEKQIKELMSIKEEYKKFKQKEIEKENRYFKDSSIIKLEDENTIINWLEKKPEKFIKLLDSKIDGDSTNAFENKCAKKCPIMVFVKTTNGYRIGGFTTIIWTNGSYGKDNKAFLFSLDKKEKYKNTNENYANHLSSGSYFCFGGAALILYNNCTSNKNNYVRSNNSFAVPTNYEFIGGDPNFTVSSYEVYQIEY